MLLLVGETGVAKSWKTFYYFFSLHLSLLRWKRKIYSFVFQFLAQTQTQKFQKNAKKNQFSVFANRSVDLLNITFIEIESQKYEIDMPRFC